MALDIATFATVKPCRFISFTIPTNSSDQLLRIAVLDSPNQTSYPPRVAAMLVPEHRESDWIFSTDSGHIQLILGSPEISRLILVGSEPPNPHPPVYNRPSIDSTRQRKIQESLEPILVALSPKSCFRNGVPEVPIWSFYEDNLISSVVVEKCIGSFVGEMLVEDVEIEIEIEIEVERCSGVMGRCRKREFRRRLRFKRMPNLVQTEMRLLPEKGFDLNNAGIAELVFRPETSVLVHPYLVPMMASLALVSSHIDELIRDGSMAKALCVGVGGGAQLTFLRDVLGFEVVGIEADEEVLRIARKYFGLEDGDFNKVWVRDAVEVIEELADRVTSDASKSCADSKFDVMMVDLDTSDTISGVSAPPLEFVQHRVLLAARMVLCDSGIFVMNVITPNKSFYQTLVHELQQVFGELYEIEDRNGENCVLVATVLPVVSSPDEDKFLVKLRHAISGAYMDSIKKI